MILRDLFSDYPTISAHAIAAIADPSNKWTRPLHVSSSFVDVAPVAKSDDYDQQHVIAHGVNDAVVPDADSKTRSPL